MGQGDIHVAIKSHRLIIRKAAESDCSIVYALWTDPRVMASAGIPGGLRMGLLKKLTQRRKVAKLLERNTCDIDVICVFSVEPRIIAGNQRPNQQGGTG
jgi:hypothetical protein